MGTDIHGGFIKVVKDQTGNVVSKQPIKTNWDFDRNYTLFAILAGVRNGYGFAGCYRHEPLVPIAEKRGLPDWFKIGDYITDEYGDFGDEGCSYFCNDYSPDFKEFMGEHSFTYMTIKEILDWEGWNNYLSQGGVVSVGHYEETIAKGKEPESWCGGVSGGGVVVVTEDEYKSGVKATHVKCFWKSEQSLGEMYSWFLEEIERIKNEYGEDVYLVIGFDS